MVTSTSVKTYSPAALQELGKLLAAIREQQGLFVREMERIHPDLKARVISRLEKGQGTGRPGNNTLNTQRIKVISDVYNVPEIFINQILIGQLTANDVLKIRGNTDAKNAFNLYREVRIIAQSLSFAEVCDLANKCNIDIKRIAEIAEGQDIETPENTRILEFVRISKTTLVLRQDSSEDNRVSNGCNEEDQTMTLGKLIQDEVRRRKIDLSDFSKITAIGEPTLKAIIDGEFSGDLRRKIKLLYAYLSNPVTESTFKSEEELLVYLSKPPCNSSNGR